MQLINFILRQERGTSPEMFTRPQKFSCIVEKSNTFEVVFVEKQKENQKPTNAFR